MPLLSQLQFEALSSVQQERLITKTLDPSLDLGSYRFSGLTPSQKRYAVYKEAYQDQVLNGNATVPNDSDIQPPQAVANLGLSIFDIMLGLSTGTLDMSGKGLTSLPIPELMSVLSSSAFDEDEVVLFRHLELGDNAFSAAWQLEFLDDLASAVGTGPYLGSGGGGSTLTLTGNEVFPLQTLKYAEDPLGGEDYEVGDTFGIIGVPGGLVTVTGINGGLIEEWEVTNQGTGGDPGFHDLEPLDVSGTGAEVSGKVFRGTLSMVLLDGAGIQVFPPT